MQRIFTVLLAASALATIAGAQTQPWVSAYYAGWMQDGYPPSAVDFGAMTHVIHFSLEPGNGGTISGTGNGITPSASQALVSTAHAAGKKAIVTVGGWGADGGFVNATNSANRATFVANLVDFMTTYSYDGIDIDWEPVTSPAQFKLFIPELRAAMTAAKPGSLLTIAVMGTDQAVIDMQSYFDQINLMTYDMSGAWSGWVTWHNSPIYDGGATFPSTGESLPSANGDIDAYLAKGVTKAKLGIGTDFYGYVWSGVSQPRESWTSTPSVQGNVSYANLMSSYGSTPASWDASAGAAYISITSPSKKFVSLDNEQTIAAKAEYVRTKGIGGIIIWEIGGGYRPSAPAGSRDVLLQAVKQAFMNGNAPDPDDEAPVVSITSPSSDAVVSGTMTVQAQASDNVGVVGVQLRIDGVAAGNEVMAAPYSASINTWSYANGPHTLSAVGRDWAGNAATASIAINVNNQGTPPSVAPLVVYDDALKSPFRDASWSATVSYTNTSPVMSGTRSVRIAFAAWGGFDLLSGNWDAEEPIDPSEYDTLRFDIYPTASVPLTVGFYSSTVDIAAPPANQWTTISVPTPPDPFTRFYIANGTGSNRTVYLDNIRFTGQGVGKVPTAIGERSEKIGDFRLDQNYPNPFNPSTTIGYSVGVVSHQSSVASSRVLLAVYDLLGREVTVLVDEKKEPGSYEVKFDASGLPSGVYLYRLQVHPLDFPLLDSAPGGIRESGTAIGRDSKSGADDFSETRTLLLLR